MLATLLPLLAVVAVSLVNSVEFKRAFGCKETASRDLENSQILIDDFNRDLDLDSFETFEASPPLLSYVHVLGTSCTSLCKVCGPRRCFTARLLLAAVDNIKHKEVWHQ